VVREFVLGRPSAAEFIFNDPHFSGSSFREILNEIGKLELVEDTMVALMQDPGLQMLGLHDGEGALKALFGDRFYHEVKSAGLLDPAVIRPKLSLQPSEPTQACTEPQFTDTRSGASPLTGSPTAAQQKLSPQQGQTGGQKLGRQLRETTETRSTKPLAPPQDDRQADHSSYREQTASISGVPLDPHSKTPPTESRFQERGTHCFSEFQSRPLPLFNCRQQFSWYISHKAT